VPSITETLVECGLNVVGRTRFCIHPKTTIKNIPSVAGTKDINWDKVAKFEPDLMIFDKEENTLEMAEACPYAYIALHITSITNISSELYRLAKHLNSDALRNVAQRWKVVAEKPNKQWTPGQTIPSALVSLETSASMNAEKIKKVDYMIWKDPWMTIGPGTFIWSVLEKLGFAKYLIKRDTKYPNIGEQLNAEPDTLYLFSSEPFPFEKYVSELERSKFIGSVVDGESYSWYGIRSLRFLEEQLS
jgi:ABC-type Fe3+-hydroxamate transport system substrate-binding protein